MGGSYNMEGFLVGCGRFLCFVFLFGFIIGFVGGGG